MSFYLPSFYQLLWYFLLYSGLGWLLEVVYCTVTTGKLVNRGFLNGPLCPIYGFGACAVLVLLQPLAGHVVWLYLASVVVASALEFIAGFLLERLFHTKWWDYSDEPFNLMGYICLKFSLLWGIGCVVLILVIQPLVAMLVSLLPTPVGIVLLCIAYALVLVDLAVTVNAVAKLNRDLGEITHIAHQLHDSSEFLSNSIGTAALSAQEKVEALNLEETKERLETSLDDGRERVAEAFEAGRERLDNALAEAQQKLRDAKDTAVAHKKRLLGSRQPVRDRLLRAFPKMSSSRYQKALEEMKEAFRRDK